MQHAKPLPKLLVQRYHGWKATHFAENASWYHRLATEGQRPKVMVISCCDSRVDAGAIFGADAGEAFAHRNIANLVPPRTAEGEPHGTGAAVEYAVTALKVAHLIVLGHSRCGGVQGCRDMCAGRAPALEEPSSLVGRWVDHLRPAHDRVAERGLPEDRQQGALEREGVLMSLENLMTFDFVREAVEAGSLSLHGLWTDIADGGLECYDPETGRFQPV